MTEDALKCRLRLVSNIVDEDDILVSEAAKDKEAFATLYDKYFSLVLGYIYHCVFNGTITEDLTSNVFLAAFRHIGRYKWRSIPFRAWLYRIATNEVRMYWRRQKLVTTVDQSEQNRRYESNAVSACDSASECEEYRMVHRALLKLRIKYRTVIILRYFEDKTIQQISEITGKKEGTIKSQLHRGLAELQDILVRWDVLPE